MVDDAVLHARGEAVAEAFGGALASLTSVSTTVAFSGVNRSAPVGAEGTSVVVPLQVSGGQGFLAIPENAAVIISELLMGQEPSETPGAMTDLHLSAFGEVGSQLAASVASVFKTPGIKSGEPRVESIPNVGNGSAVWTFVLDVPNAWNGKLWLVLPESAADAQAAGAGKPAAKAPSGGTHSGPPKGGPALAGGVAVQTDQMTGATGGNISLLMDVPLKLTVELGRTTKMVKEILALAPGSVVELDKLAGEPVDILVNERLIAKGEVVVIDENFGVRITEIVNPEERLHGLKP